MTCLDLQLNGSLLFLGYQLLSLLYSTVSFVNSLFYNRIAYSLFPSSRFWFQLQELHIGAKQLNWLTSSLSLKSSMLSKYLHQSILDIVPTLYNQDYLLIYSQSYLPFQNITWIYQDFYQNFG